MQKDKLFNYFVETRKKSLEICKRIEIEDYSVQPHPDISPPKWHLAHSSWFFEQVILLKTNKIKKPYNKKFNLIFNSYYKAAGSHWKQSERGLLSRPTVKEILQYRKYINLEIKNIFKSKDKYKKYHGLIELGIHHEQQHQELLYMDIKYIYAANPSYPSYEKKNLPTNLSKRPTWENFKENIYNIGHNNDSFSYDNEKPNHKKYLYSFKIRKNLVTNKEFLTFIKDQGYENPKYWLSKGWDWIKNNKIYQPLYWHNINNKWYEYTLHGLKKLNLNNPVCHVSYFEAYAFCQWAGNRLPTEEESEVYLNSIKNTKPKTSDILHATSTNKNINNLWWWTKSHYSSYPGYDPYKGILEEYNEKFMCNQFVLKGGSFATPKNHFRNTYRNFYEPHQRWMFSGIRMARDVK